MIQVDSYWTVSSRQREEEREAREGGCVPGDGGQGGLRVAVALRESLRPKIKCSFTSCVSSEKFRFFLRLLY